MKTWNAFLLALLFGLTTVLVTAPAFAQDEEEDEEYTEEADAVIVEASGDLVPLMLELPRPKFVGTPKDLKVPNLERPRKGKRPPILVPAGLTNVALGKPVTASDDEPIIGDLPLITDGDKEADDGSYVEFGPGVQWVQIDLGEPMSLYAVALWHYHQMARVYHDVIVLLSDDPGFKEGVQVLFNNDHDNSAKLGIGKDKAYIETSEGKLIETRGATGRYLRLYSNGSTSNDMNHYTEVEVYGRPAE